MILKFCVIYWKCSFCYKYSNNLKYLFLKESTFLESYYWWVDYYRLGLCVRPVCWFFIEGFYKLTVKGCVIKRFILFKFMGFFWTITINNFERTNWRIAFKRTFYEYYGGTWWIVYFTLSFLFIIGPHSNVLSTVWII